MTGPDIEGFRDAQVTLREAFSQPVTFRMPSATIWPADTQLDPESGVPYDPTVEPISSGFGEYPTSAEVFRGQRAGRDSPEVATAIGEIEVGQAVLALDPDEEDDVAEATEVVIDGVVFRITAARETLSIGPVEADRHLIWVEQE